MCSVAIVTLQIYLLGKETKFVRLLKGRLNEHTVITQLTELHNKKITPHCPFT